MHEMKNSGIEWVGEIPAHWEVKKLYKVVPIITDFVASGSFATIKENVKYLDYPDYAMLVRTADLSGTKDKPVYISKHSYDFLSNSNLSGGEVILSNVGSVGNVYIYEPLYKRSSLAPNAIMLNGSKNNRYIYYWFLSPHSTEELKHISGDNVQLKFNKTQLRQVKIAIPPIEEQKKIASFLDKKCADIDYIISGLKKQTETLAEYKKSLITETVTKGLNPDVKMKDSGIEWVGDIPAHWEVKKLKYSCSTRNEKYTLSAGKLDYFALENIVSWDSRYIETESIYQLEGANLCYKGDVVFGKLRPYLAKTFLVDYDRCCSSEFAVFCNFQGVSKYYLYVFTEQGFINTVDNSTYGVKMPRANIGFIENMFIPVPPVEEQQQIAEYLDRKCTEIDGIISGKKKQIKAMEEYKKSLIYEVVTGKRGI